MAANWYPAASLATDEATAGIAAVPICRVVDDAASPNEDHLAVEEPLDIRLGCTTEQGPVVQSVSITMRTPGDDAALACGFLFTEGLIKNRSDVLNVRRCGLTAGPPKRHNVIRIDLRDTASIDLERLKRHFYTSSSCGVCGKTALEALHVAGVSTLADASLVVAAHLVHLLPTRLRRAQPVFAQTGGLHAAGLFTADGELALLKEDVGRHNAVDKVIGAAFLKGHTQLGRHMLVVSGRASFELVQKALVAKIPLLAAVGAPSSLAVALAQHYGMTLLGFVRDGRFNIYAGGHRIKIGSDPPFTA